MRALAAQYFRKHWVITAVVTYFLFSVLLKLFAIIDITIPCIWKTFFHFECPGCGLTRAFMHLLTLDFHGAYEMNKMIFIVVPAILFYLISDTIKFVKSEK